MRWLIRTSVGLLVGMTFAAQAEESCAPLEPGAHILRSKNKADVHRDWKPPSRIGTSWSLIKVKHEGEFLSGRLVSPRGGVQRGRVYVIAREWDCSG